MAKIEFLENEESPLKDRLTSEESFSLILAVLGHDIGHLGRTNHFLAMTKHEFYLENQDSPNEAMHFRLFTEKLLKWVRFGQRLGLALGLKSVKWVKKIYCNLMKKF